MQERAFGRRREDAVPFATARADRDDELNLVDLWLVVHRRWPWLLAGLLAGVTAATAYLMLSTPIYEARASVSIGKLADVGLLEDSGIVAARLLEQHGRRRGTPYLKEATQATRQGGMLTLVAVAHAPEDARDFLAQVVSDLVKRHEATLQAALDPLRQRLEAIDDRIGSLRTQAGQLNELVARLQESDPGQAAVVAIERGDLYPEMSQLERDRLELQRLTSWPQSEPTRVITDPVAMNSPAAPQYAMSMGIGVVIGLALGVLAVFLREFFAIIHAKTPAESRSSKRAYG